LFDEAEEGDLSKLEKGGDNHLLVVYLSKINNNGYIGLDLIKDYITELVKKDKKAELIVSKLNGINELEQIKSKADATIDTVKHVSFAAPTFVSATSSNEALIGAISSKTEAGKISEPIKGNMGVYMLKVLSSNKTTEEFKATDEQKTLSNQYFQIAINGILTDLIKNAEIEDLRYKFY
jgi:peptidyl-prolyl cis-trans isomerase D